jgi:hypothetical protein
MKALFAQKALYSASPILPQAAFPALPARGGAAGRKHLVRTEGIDRSRTLHAANFPIQIFLIRNQALIIIQSPAPSVHLASHGTCRKPSPATGNASLCRSMSQVRRLQMPMGAH